MGYGAGVFAKTAAKRWKSTAPWARRVRSRGQRVSCRVPCTRPWATPQAMASRAQGERSA